MKELLEMVAKALVDHPDEVAVRSVEGQEVVVLEHPFANATLARAQTHFFIFSASKISPHLARPVSGRFTNARCEAQMHPKGKPCRYVLNPHNPIGAANISCLPLCCV